MNPELRYRMLWLVIGYLLIMVVTYLSLTGSPPQVDIKNFDKVGHFAAYGTLMFWFAMIYHVKKQRLLWAIFFIGMGITMEFLQGMTPERYFEYADMVANTIGVGIGFSLALTGLQNSLVKVEYFMK